MSRTRWIGGSCVAAGLAALLAGCGGSSSHTVSTASQGSLRGVDFTPVDHTLSVAVETNPRVYWHTGYTPPAQFIVSLKEVSMDSTKDSVLTELKRIGEGDVWELEPTSDLDPESFYFIEVEAAPESEVSMFLTEPGQTSKDRSVESPTRETGAFEHVVLRDGP